MTLLLLFFTFIILSLFMCRGKPMPFFLAAGLNNKKISM